jgi:GGDEF domain-containing protein
MASPESTRARRFALPDLDDERAGASIEAFIEGRGIRRDQPPGPPTARTGSSAERRARADIRTLPGRLEWNAALARESARAARYRRPAAVAVVELSAIQPDQPVDPWVPTLVGPIARVLRGDSRATDVVARVSSTRFQLLMPETSEVGAERLAERLLVGCRDVIEPTDAPVAVRIAVAGTGLHGTLDDALASAAADVRPEGRLV